MPGVWPLRSCNVRVIFMNHAAIDSVIPMYHTLVYMLDAVWLLVKSESSIKIMIRIMKDLAHTQLE